MIVCHSCYQKNSMIIHGSHDVSDNDGKTEYIYTQSTCKICNTIHEVYEPVGNENE